MDILFVVDDSNSMAQEQANLGNAYPEFARVLEEFKITTGEQLDYRVAVTTTDRPVHFLRTINRQLYAGVAGSQNGVFHRAPDMIRRWLERADPKRTEQFAVIANAGIGGSGWEMPLDAARLALSTQHAAGRPNAGFLRDDALLATVLLTDEEDCSRNDLRTSSNRINLSSARLNADREEALVCATSKLAPVKEFVDFFDKLKGKRERWATAVIAAGERSCESTGLGKAEASPRLVEFTKQTGKNAVFHSICSGDLAAALEEALAKFQQACLDLPPVD